MLVPAPDHEVVVAAPHDRVVAGVKLARVIPRNVDIVYSVDIVDIVDNKYCRYNYEGVLLGGVAVVALPPVSQHTARHLQLDVVFLHAVHL